METWNTLIVERDREQKITLAKNNFFCQYKREYFGLLRLFSFIFKFSDLPEGSG